MINRVRIASVRCLGPLLGTACALSLASCASIEGSDANDNDTSLASDTGLAELDTSRSCFNQREIHGYSRGPDGQGTRERIHLDTGLNEQFVLETTGACPDLDFSRRIRLSQQTIGNICTGDLESLVISSGIPQESRECPVRVLGRVPEG